MKDRDARGLAVGFVCLLIGAPLAYWGLALSLAMFGDPLWFFQIVLSSDDAAPGYIDALLYGGLLLIVLGGGLGAWLARSRVIRGVLVLEGALALATMTFLGVQSVGDAKERAAHQEEAGFLRERGQELEGLYARARATGAFTLTERYAAPSGDLIVGFFGFAPGSAADLRVEVGSLKGLTFLSATTDASWPSHPQPSASPLPYQRFVVLWEDAPAEGTMFAGSSEASLPRRIEDARIRRALLAAMNAHP